MQKENYNFLPDQYQSTGEPTINHNYLKDQFSDYKDIFLKIEKLIVKGDYTLGKEVDIFEQRYAELTGTKYAIGVGSGTDALFLSLKALGVGPGDEVITTAFTFYATIGAIVTAGARPVFVDVGDDYNINADAIESAISKNTKAILPVHWSGLVCDMDKIKNIADKHGLAIVEDSCHGIRAKYNDQYAGSFGDTGCFSMHPLKNLNVWGDGGVIVTNNQELHRKLSLLRNHGLLDRNRCEIFAYNSRLDTLQAIVANHLLDKIDHITERRIANAKYLDKALREISEITVPERADNKKQVFHIYSVLGKNRDELQKHLVANNVDAKVHYPIPMHLQPAAKDYGYKRGDFPNAERISDTTISLPVHEFITTEQLDATISAVRSFYQ